MTGPYAILQDGIWYWQYFDLYTCSTPTGGQPTCNTASDWSAIATSYVCPPPYGAGIYNSTSGPPQTRLIACAFTPSVRPPPPKDCKSCLGNPIFAATGQKLEVQTDYSGLPGLNFTRTYRSSNGSFSSVVTQSLFNNSLPAGTTSAGCFYGPWTQGNQGGWYCYPYISVYPYVNNGVATYALNTHDGLSIGFSGNGTITANADINDRLTSITFNGASAWQANREDDSIEIYSATGSLLQKTLRGGQTEMDPQI